MLTINFEETELRLGLPGGSLSNTTNNNGKRGFSETQLIINNNNKNNVDLKLNLSSVNNNNNNIIKEFKVVDQIVGVTSNSNVTITNNSKLKDKVVNDNNNNKIKAVDPTKPPAKAQVVGWPPVRSFRKNIVTVQKKNTDEETELKTPKNINNNNTTNASFVKVSMDGAPYLRKVDLKLYNSYQNLSDALAKMFSSFTIGNCGSQENEGTKDFMNESKLIDLLSGSEYAATYEDKDGDWMLVGDVPWPMFVESCKRLRIMKGSEAIGLAPRAVEKCKSRS